MEETANSILVQIPKPVDVELVMTMYPVLYEQSMNTVLVQEIIRSVAVWLSSGVIPVLETFFLISSAAYSHTVSARC